MTAHNLAHGDRVTDESGQEWRVLQAPSKSAPSILIESVDGPYQTHWVAALSLRPYPPAPKPRKPRKKAAPKPAPVEEPSE